MKYIRTCPNPTDNHKCKKEIEYQRKLNVLKGTSITTIDNYDGHLNRITMELLKKWFGLPKLIKIK